MPLSEDLKRFTCYDVLPVSHKIIVFDTSLLVKKALAALVQHGAQSAPLWDSSRNSFAGMLTVTDFIHLILYYYENASYEAALQEIEQLQIATLREFERKQNLVAVNTVTIHPMESLSDACRLLVEHDLRRLPLIDSNEDGEMIVSVITQYKILKYIAANVRFQRVAKFFHSGSEHMSKTVGELKIGTYGNIAVASPTSQIVDVLRLFIKHKISAVPIVDENNNVLDVYEKIDVLALAKDGSYSNLEVPVKDALVKRSPAIHTCTITDTLGAILETIRRMVVHRFVVLDSDNKLLGMLCLSDILQFLLQKDA
ncbi:hypothetical protein BJ742DRAFT_746718 [Cladochytrium replicatum]|nr:hypothetical protein BJ742DRAFT_746718 [Cladochytrium replicatum]